MAAEIKPLNKANYYEMEREDRGRRPVKVKRVLADDSNRCFNFTTTFAIYYCNFCLGISANFVGLALLDFRDSLHTDIATISLIFTVIMASMLTSNIFFGVIYNYVNRHAVVVGLLFTMAVAVVALPHSDSVTTFFVLGAILAVASGGWVTAQAVWVIEIWKDAAGPFIQAQHFFYAIGSIFPPLIFGPFLSHSRGTPEDAVLAASNSTDVIIISDTNATSTEGPQVLDTSNSLATPCLVSGVIIAIGAVVQLVILLVVKKPESADRMDAAQGNDKLLSPAKSAEPAGVMMPDGALLTLKRPPSFARNALLILLSAILVGAWQSMEASCGQFLAPFTHFAPVGLSEADGANVFFYYTIAFTLGRACGIFAILKISPQLILCFNFVLAISANVLLLTYGVHNVEHLWIGTMLLGFGLSSSIPSVFAYIKNHIEITNFVGAFLMAFGGVLASTYPIVVGNFIEQVPVVLMYVNFGSMCLGVMAFTCIFCLTKRRCY